jgi:hypothetical protein
LARFGEAPSDTVRSGIAYLENPAMGFSLDGNLDLAQKEKY